jgi:hypothetical protein
LAVAAGKTWNQHGVAELFFAAPDATQWRDHVTGLPPALVASSSATATTALRQEGSHHATNIITELERLLEASDPYHLLTRKRHELLEKRRASAAAASDDDVQSNYFLDAETQQLETIYQLLKADPSAATVMAM